MARVLATIALLLAFTTTLASAQGRGRSSAVPVEKCRGFWLGVGAGGGWEDVESAFGNFGRGGSAYLRMGGTVNQHLLVGGEALVWFRESRGREIDRANVTITSLVYPIRSGGWFLKGGFGAASFGVNGGDSSGIGATIGTGFDFRMGRDSNFYLTPNVDLLVQLFEGESNTSMVFTLGATWH